MQAGLAAPLAQAITCNNPDIQAAAMQVCQSASVCSCCAGLAHRQPRLAMCRQLCLQHAALQLQCVRMFSSGFDSQDEHDLISAFESTQQGL